MYRQNVDIWTVASVSALYGAIVAANAEKDQFQDVGLVF